MRKYGILLASALLFGCGLAPPKNAIEGTEHSMENTSSGKMPATHQMGHEHHMNMEHMSSENHSTHASNMKGGSMYDPFGGFYKTMGADCGGFILCAGSSYGNMYHAMLSDEWSIMGHGMMNLTYTLQPSPRGIDAFAAPNHFMFMLDHGLLGGTMRVTLGTSFDAFTEHEWGKPQLLQTGELFNGRENVDVQHRHKFITNLSTSYIRPISFLDDSDWFCSFALLGDVSGAPMEYHRASARPFVDVSLFHHGTTDKHITSSVILCGMDIGKLRFTAATFHGQEPGSDPYKLEIGRPDSFAGSVQYSLSKNWAFSLYYANVHNAERTEPGDIRRFTAMGMYTRPFSEYDWWATTTILTHETGPHGPGNIFVLDSTLRWQNNYFYGRIDLGDKGASLLGANTFGRPGVRHVDMALHEHEDFDQDKQRLLIGAGTLGYAHVLYQKKSVELGVGADVTGYALPPELRGVYGSFPVSANMYIFLNF